MLLFHYEVNRSVFMSSMYFAILQGDVFWSCRCHIIAQFNQGFYDYIIATDEHSLAEPSGNKEKKTAGKKKKGKGEK